MFTKAHLRIFSVSKIWTSELARVAAMCNLLHGAPGAAATCFID